MVHGADARIVYIDAASAEQAMQRLGAGEPGAGPLRATFLTPDEALDRESCARYPSTVRRRRRA